MSEPDIKKFKISYHGTCGFAGCDMYEEEIVEAEDDEAALDMASDVDCMVQEYYQLEGWIDIEEIEED